VFRVRYGLGSYMLFRRNSVLIQSQNYVTTDSHSASLFLASSPHLGPKTRFFLLSDSCGFVDAGRPP
jgi:hypothetical protein